MKLKTTIVAALLVTTLLSTPAHAMMEQQKPFDVAKNTAMLKNFSIALICVGVFVGCLGVAQKLGYTITQSPQSSEPKPPTQNDPAPQVTGLDGLPSTPALIGISLSDAEQRIVIGFGLAACAALWYCVTDIAQKSATNPNGYLYPMARHMW